MGKGRITYERGFHSFRHTFTAWLRKAGVSEEDRMALTGHSTRESHGIYSHEDEEALKNAIAKLPSIAE
jgi:integrase